MKRKSLVITCAASLLSLTPLVDCNAAVIVNDTFADGGVTDGADPNDVNWVSRTSTTLAVGTQAFNTSGNTTTAGLFNSSYTTSGDFPWLNAVFANQLLAVNDSIRLTMDLRLTNATIPNSSGGMRFGLANLNNTFAFTFGLGTSASRNFIRYDNSGTQFAPSGTSTTAAGVSGTAVALNDNAPHAFSLTFTRTSLTDLSVSASLDGVTSTGSFTLTNTTNNFTFNRIVLGEGGVNNVDFTFDNVVVEVNPVPEPGMIAYSFLGLGALLLCRRRRRI